MVEFHTDVPFEEFYRLSEYDLETLLRLQEASAPAGSQCQGDNSKDGYTQLRPLCELSFTGTTCDCN
jgi:hypothetical protein